MTGVEYVIFDEGWSETLNIWKFHPNVDVPHLIDYAGKKGVGIILWMAWAQIAGNEEKVAAHFAKLGAKGFKVDFMDRADAEVERFLWKFAVAARKAKDGSWYAAAINASKAHDFVLDTSFLGEGDWVAEVFRDAEDAATAPAHCVHERGNAVKAGERKFFRMAPGGGFVMKFTRKDLDD